MAGDWIKMRVDLAEDPAVIAMASSLQVHETHVVGMLHKVWAWADRHAENGHAKNVTVSWLDRYIGVTGFSQAMQEAGWLLVDNGVRFPDFDRHNGESAKKRAHATERKRLERVRHKEVTTLSRKVSDKSVTREEKRREEVKDKSMAASRPAHSQAKKQRQTPLPADFAVSDRVKTWAAEKGLTRLPEHLDAFKRKCAAKGYAYVDHDAAFMEAIREDWAKLRGDGRAGVAPAPIADGKITCRGCGTRVTSHTNYICGPCARAADPEHRAAA